MSRYTGPTAARQVDVTRGARSENPGRSSPCTELAVRLRAASIERSLDNRFASAASVSRRSHRDKKAVAARRPQPHCGSSRRAAQARGVKGSRSILTDMDKTPARTVSAEAVETLVWLLDTNGVDRRRYRIVNRLRSVRDSDEFATLPADLRGRVREIVAESER